MAATAALAFGIGLAGAAPSLANHQTVVGLTDADELVQFAVGSPETLISGPTTIGGAATGNLVGIDYRPRTNTLFAVNDAGAVLLLTPTLAAGTGPSESASAWTATNIGDNVTTPNAQSGVDFNPVPDAIRIVDIDEENIRLNPNTGALLDGDPFTPLVQQDAALNGLTAPDVAAAAYTNAFDGATATTLYDVDASNDLLAIQNPPNDGTLSAVGALGINVTTSAGLDIEPFTNNTPYAALETLGDGSSRFYRLDLTTGAAGTALGSGAPFIGGGTPQLLDGISLVPTSTASFVNAVTSVAENGGDATVTVTRVGPLNQTATMNYATSTDPGDTATEGVDYTAASGTLTFAAGDASESFTVPISNDTGDETDETFTTSLSAPSRSVNFPSAPPLTAKVNIVDNDDSAAGKGGAPIGLISVQSQKIKKSLKAKYSCDEACTAKLDLKLGAKKIDSQSESQTADGGVNNVTFKLSKSEVKKAKKKARGKKVATFKINGTFSNANGSTTSKVKFQLG